MKPIEPGCLAVIHGLVFFDKYNGKSVTVLKKVMPGDHLGHTKSGADVFYGPDHLGEGWFCEGEIASEHLNGFAVLAEKNLLRIDGSEDLETVEERKKERVQS